MHRMALPLGIHGVPTVSAYLLHGDAGDVLVDCGIAAGPEPAVPGGEPGPVRRAGRRRCGRPGAALERIARLVVTHAHIDHFGLAGEVVRRSGGELWMHEAGRLDLDKYHDPDEAVDRRMLMLADHGLYGRGAHRELGGPARLDAGDALDRDAGPAAVRRRAARRGRPELGGRAHARALAGARLPLVGGRPGALLGRPPAADRVPTGDLRARVRARPDGVLPGLPGPGGRARSRSWCCPGTARRSGTVPAGPATIARSKRRRLDQIRDMVVEREQTVTEITADPVPRRTDRCAAPLR